jgi:C4-dicarboxylate transporter DctM subunit
VSPEFVGLLFFAVLVLLIFSGLPVAFAMAITGITGLWMISGWQSTGMILGMVPWQKVTVYSFTVIPLFVFMGNLFYHCDFGKELYSAGRKWLGHWPGGLAQATVLGNAFFGAACGSTGAAAATFSKVAVPEMLKYNYDKSLATASVAASGTMASMIPPSIAFVLYAMVTEQSVGKLLIAGFLPGLLEACSYMVQIGVRCRLNPKLGAAMERSSWRERIVGLKSVWAVAAIILFVMGSIYTGICTPTEAGALGAGGALMLGIFSLRLSIRTIWDSMLDTAKTVGMVFAIIACAFIFNSMVAVSQLHQLAVTFVTGLPIPPLGILICIMVLFLILGTFMSGLAILFLTMPVLFPVVLSMGWNPIWFGCLFVQIHEMGMITPPFGITLFAVRASLPEISMQDILKGILPFNIADCIVLGLMIAFPQISLFLPNTMS